MRSLAFNKSLECIAGTPLALLTVPNTTSNPLNIGPTEARTLYAVGSTTAQSNNTTVASIGSSSNTSNGMLGAQVIRSSNQGMGGLGHLGGCIGGSYVFQAIQVNWPFNKPLAACAWWDGSIFGSQGYLGSTIVSAPATGLSMITTPRLRIGPIAADGTTPIAALAYRGVHDLATRTSVLAWLMQRYGNL